MDLPLPEATNSTPKDFRQYKAISLDVYGSLIEYKGHILQAFHPLISRLPLSSPYRKEGLIDPSVQDSASIGSIEFLRLFQKEEDTIKLEKPIRRFDEILAEIWRRIAVRLEVKSSEDEAKHFGSEEVIASWPCFPGTAEALQILGKHYHLIALSNIDPYAWEITSKSSASGIGQIEWDKVFTAADYDQDASRADLAKLETCIDYCAQQGITKEEILHVAQSLGHDHAPAKKLGLDSVWLVGDGPRWGKQEESKTVLEKKLVGYKWKAPNLLEFAQEVEAAWVDKQ